MTHPKRWALNLLLIASVAVTLLVYVVLVPRHGLQGGVGYFVLGWVPFALSWYAAGRRFGSPGSVPSMRPIDLGAGLVIVALLVSIAVDAWGFAPADVPLGHVVQALAIFVGLALFGWGIGQRSAALNRLDSNRSAR